MTANSMTLPCSEFSDIIPVADISQSGNIYTMIITGVSGAGKSQAIKCLEDIGFFCIDNLPTTLIPTFVRLCMQSEHTIERVALVIDVRGGEFLAPVFDILAMLRADGHTVKIVFLDASNEVLDSDRGPRDRSRRVG